MKSRVMALTILSLLILTGCSLVKPPITSQQGNQNQTTIPPGSFYFYSATCQHCAVVNQYVIDNKVKDRLFYIEAPIDNNQEHVRLLQSIGERCGVSPSDLGVPFFWDGTRCYQGSDEVISFFESSN